MNNSAETDYQKGLFAYQNNDQQKAQKLFKRALKSNPAHGPSLFSLAKIELMNGRKATAKTYFKKIIHYYPDHGDSWLNLGLIYYLHDNLMVDAIEAFENALKFGADASLCYLYLGDIFQNTGSYDSALVMYQKSLEQNPNQSLTLSALGNLSFSMKDIQGSLAYLLKSLELKPHNDAVVMNIIVACDYLKKSPQDVLTKDLYEKLSDYSKNIIQAHILYKNEEYTAAIDLYEGLPIQTTEREIYRCHTLSTLYDKIQRYKEAFEWATKANAYKLQTKQALLIDKASYFKRLDALQAFSSKEAAKDIQQSHNEAQHENTPVFLVGFPRSGTTLTGRILSRHSKIHVNDETSALDQLVIEIEHSFGLSYPNDLANLSSEQCDALRQSYWAQHNAAGKFKKSDIFIDKFPLNIIHIPLIQRIFPDAKIIYVKRHPLDSITSCYMQHFKLNNAMVQFLDLHSAAKTYNKVLSLWHSYKDNYNIVSHTISYEKIVSDFDSEIAAVLSFLEIKWEDDLRSFYKTNEQSMLTVTPSATQVTQKLYTNAVSRWKNYEADLMPIINEMKPICEALEYNL